MSLTISTRTYAADRVNPDSVDFAGPANTLSVKDMFQTKRIYPKRGTNGSAGVARPSCKRTATTVVNATTGAVDDVILRCEGSIPVGATDTVIEAVIADMVSYLSSAAGKSLFKTLALGS